LSERFVWRKFGTNENTNEESQSGKLSPMENGSTKPPNVTGFPTTPSTWCLGRPGAACPLQHWTSTTRRREQHALYFNGFRMNGCPYTDEPTCGGVDARQSVNQSTKGIFRGHGGGASGGLYIVGREGGPTPCDRFLRGGCGGRSGRAREGAPRKTIHLSRSQAARPCPPPPPFFL
jgi:hypothetical protein